MEGKILPFLRAIIKLTKTSRIRFNLDLLAILAGIIGMIVGFCFRKNVYDWETPISFSIIFICMEILIIFPIIVFTIKIDLCNKEVLIPRPGYYVHNDHLTYIELSFTDHGPKIDTGLRSYIPDKWEYLETGLLIDGNILLLNEGDNEPENVDRFSYVPDQTKIEWNSEKGFYQK